MSLRLRYTVLTSVAFLTVFLSTYFYRSGLTFSLTNNDISSHPILTQLHDAIIPPTPPPPPPPPQPPIYKPTASAPAIPIVDNFPLAASAHSAAELPPLPSWNAPPSPHVKENTPLFIGFTRNWRLLQQVVVSYITSGWPASDIYVVENTGVMDSNALGLLSLQNPFFLNHTRLQMLGVNVLVTPTLLTFAQLQNFYLWTATEKDWAHYFWSHMDVAALSLESAARFPSTNPTFAESSAEPEEWEKHTLYANCLSWLRNVTSVLPTSGQPIKWASVFYSYDRLALVNVAAFKSIGAWDTMIPFYMTDCDMHARLTMGGYEIFERKAGLVYDVASSLDDLSVLYRQKSGPKGDIGEASWVDPNLLEKIREDEERAARAGLEKESPRKDKRDEKGEDKGEDTDHQAWSLAALFAPHSSPSKPSTSQSNPEPDPELWHSDTPSSPAYIHLTDILDSMQGSKGSSSHGRNTWQARQSGGQGEPFYRDSAGFEKGIQMTIEHGRAMFREKWGHRDCDIYEVGLRTADAWRVEHDWKD